jgi:hypothetical protein
MEDQYATNFLRIPNAIAAQKCRKLPSSVIVFQTFVPETFFQSGKVHKVSHMSDRPFGIRIVMTGPLIARWFRGLNYWMGQLSNMCLLLIKSTRHHRLSETQIQMCLQKSK